MITLCTNYTCELRLTCKRFMTEPESLQWYSSFNPDANNECEYYLEL